MILTVQSCTSYVSVSRCWSPRPQNPQALNLRVLVAWGETWGDFREQILLFKTFFFSPSFFYASCVGLHLKSAQSNLTCYTLQEQHSALFFYGPIVLFLYHLQSPISAGAAPHVAAEHSSGTTAQVYQQIAHFSVPLQPFLEKCYRPWQNPSHGMR